MRFYERIALLMSGLLAAHRIAHGAVDTTQVGAALEAPPECAMRAASGLASELLVARRRLEEEFAVESFCCVETTDPAGDDACTSCLDMVDAEASWCGRSETFCGWCSGVWCEASTLPGEDDGTAAADASVDATEDAITADGNGGDDDDGSGMCALVFGILAYEGPNVRLWTRGYLDNGAAAMLGPTVRVRAGQKFGMQLINTLSEAGNDPNAYDPFTGFPMPHLPNTTNLHTHGLHVSGAPPGDNVFVSVGPGESYEYEYEVPPGHMGGTFWYHPHHHGASTLQLGAGAFGFLIIEDEDGDVPDEIAAMEEVLLAFAYIEPQRLGQVQNLYKDQNGKGNNIVVSGSQEAFLLTNGQVSPVLAVVSGTWYRFRMLYTSIMHLASFELRTVSGSAACAFELLAKDGIYLATAPRSVGAVHLPNGGRADAAVRCTGTGSVGLFATLSNSGPGEVDWPLALTLTVGASEGGGSVAAAAVLAPFVPRRPCYLVDTRTTLPSTYLDLTLGSGNPNTKLNDQWFISPETSLNPTNPLVTGTLGQLTLVQGLYVHVLHLHVFPFQLVFLPRVHDPIYFQVGDWHDTFNAFVSQVDAHGTIVRLWVDQFAGHAVVHCHMSNDEDEGMMNTFLVEGVEGRGCEGLARQADPLCYTDLTGRGYS